MAGCDFRESSKIQKSTKQALLHELMHHFPYATFSVAFALISLAAMHIIHGSLHSVASVAHTCHGHAHDHHLHENVWFVGFHIFHFIHILFATSGAMVTFYRYSNKLWYGVLMGAVSAVVFCTLSDILLPYAAGIMLGVDMQLHICFASELKNILPFLLVGLITGLCMSKIAAFKTEQSSLSLHFWHTLTSSYASIFYAIAHGLGAYYNFVGMFFALMVVAVILPCIMSDIVAPMIFARLVSKDA